MSERQVKKIRKEQPQEKAKVAKKSGTGFNLILALIMVAALAFGGYAIYNQYKINHPSMDPETVSDRAKSEGLTTEDFMAKYGIDTVESVDADTEMAVATGYMTIEKYAEYEGTTVDELIANYGFAEGVTNDMTMNDAQEYIPMSKAVEMMGVDYATMLQMYGLTEEQLPQDMLFKDAKPILEEAQNKLMAESEAEGEAEVETDTDTEAEAE